MNIDDIRGSVARGWCQPETSSKVMDPDLAEAIAQQVHSDLSSPLGAVAMRDACLDVYVKGDWDWFSDAHDAMAEIPLPTHAALLAAALALPEVAALREAAKDMYDYGTCLADRKYHLALSNALATVEASHDHA